MNIEDKLPKAEDVLKEHCNTEYSKEGNELVVSSVSAVLIAMDEYTKRVLDVVAEEARLETQFQKDKPITSITAKLSSGAQVRVDKQSILRFKELLK